MANTFAFSRAHFFFYIYIMAAKNDLSFSLGHSFPSSPLHSRRSFPWAASPFITNLILSTLVFLYRSPPPQAAAVAAVATTTHRFPNEEWKNHYFRNGLDETSCGKFDKKPFLIRFRNRKYPFSDFFFCL